MAQDPKAAALAKAKLLINLATNHAATTDEARTAAVQALKLLTQHGLIDRLNDPTPQGRSQPYEPPPPPQPPPSPEPPPRPRPPPAGPQRYVPPSPHNRYANTPSPQPRVVRVGPPSSYDDIPPRPRKAPPKPEPEVVHDDASSFNPIDGYYEAPPSFDPYQQDFFTRTASAYHQPQRVNRPARGVRMSAPRQDACRKCGGAVNAGSAIVWVTNWGPVHLRCADR